MKTYIAKFDWSKNEDIYVIINNKVLKTSIQKTRITDSNDSIKYDGVEAKTISGLKVEYLVFGEAIPQGESCVTHSMNWIDESDIFATREELISKIV